MKKLLSVLSLATVFSCQSANPRLSPAGVPALVPEVQTAEWAQSWWMPRHEQKLADLATQGEVDLLWIGDSITHGWEQEGRAIWDRYYSHRKAFNLGFSGDRTEQVLWRLAHGAVEGISPRLTVVMIGTNNTGHRQDPPSETAEGIRAIVEDLQQRLPTSKILLLAIFPRDATAKGDLRRLNAKVNKIIARLGDGEKIVYLDINRAFLGADGALSEEVMPDLLHPSEDGYALWAEAMEPTIKRLLGES